MVMGSITGSNRVLLKDEGLGEVRCLPCALAARARPRRRHSGGATADVAVFALHAYAFPGFAPAREIDGHVHGNVRPRAFKSATRHGVGDLALTAPYCSIRRGVELESDAFLLGRVGHKTTRQKFRGARCFA